MGGLGEKGFENFENERFSKDKQHKEQEHGSQSVVMIGCWKIPEKNVRVSVSWPMSGSTLFATKTRACASLIHLLVSITCVGAATRQSQLEAFKSEKPLGRAIGSWLLSYCTLATLWTLQISEGACHGARNKARLAILAHLNVAKQQRQAESFHTLLTLFTC